MLVVSVACVRLKKFQGAISVEVARRERELTVGIGSIVPDLLARNTIMYFAALLIVSPAVYSGKYFSSGTCNIAKVPSHCGLSGAKDEYYAPWAVYS